MAAGETQKKSSHQDGRRLHRGGGDGGHRRVLLVEVVAHTQSRTVRTERTFSCLLSVAPVNVVVCLSCTVPGNMKKGSSSTSVTAAAATAAAAAAAMGYDLSNPHSLLVAGNPDTLGLMQPQQHHQQQQHHQHMQQQAHHEHQQVGHLFFQ